MAIREDYSIQFIEKQQAALVKCTRDHTPPSAHEIIGCTLVSLVSSGSERGAYMDYFGGTTYPTETGYAVVMEVLEIGAAVTNVIVGDIVLALAPHRAYNRVKDDEIIHVPAGMLAEHAVVGRFPAVSMTSMIHTRIRPTESVLVTGLGVVGLMCAQVMQHCGYKVYAFDPNVKRREVAESCGLRHVYGSPDDVPEVKGVAGLAMECSGREDAVYSLMTNLRKGGELYLIGVPWYRSTDTFAHELLLNIFYGYIHVYSGWEWSLPRHSKDFEPNSSHNSIEKAMEWIREGLIKVEGIYDIVPPSHCAGVYESIANGTLQKTCVIFDWRSL
ncbi:MAG: zinc-binding dehydrogenase [Gorillibacterium sp.]|nr:zinc-binding dehydrogenase [Gorillibacterium sp.]